MNKQQLCVSRYAICFFKKRLYKSFYVFSAKHLLSTLCLRPLSERGLPFPRVLKNCYL